MNSLSIPSRVISSIRDQDKFKYDPVMEKAYTTCWSLAAGFWSLKRAIDVCSPQTSRLSREIHPWELLLLLINQRRFIVCCYWSTTEGLCPRISSSLSDRSYTGPRHTEQHKQWPGVRGALICANGGSNFRPTQLLWKQQQKRWRFYLSLSITNVHTL